MQQHDSPAVFGFVQMTFKAIEVLAGNKSTDLCNCFVEESSSEGSLDHHDKWWPSRATIHHTPLSIDT